MKTGRRVGVVCPGSSARAHKTICPSEVARALGGPSPDDWRALMPPVRRVAVRLMKAGEIAILRKSKPVADPEDFRGVYRLGVGPDV